MLYLKNIPEGVMANCGIRSANTLSERALKLERERERERERLKVSTR